MRIIYDDKAQQKAIDNCYDILCKLNRNLPTVTRYFWGCDRVKEELVRAYFARELKEYGFKVGETATHAHGIGNNNSYPIYWVAQDGNLEHCANINLNDDMYGGVYYYLSDFEEHRITQAYNISKHGITIS